MNFQASSKQPFSADEHRDCSTVKSAQDRAEPTSLRELFSEKSFYLQQFRRRSLLFALVPPAGSRSAELNSLLKTLRELKRNQTRCVVVATENALPTVTKRLSRLKPESVNQILIPVQYQRWHPYPPDTTIGELWLALSRSAIALVAIKTDQAHDFLRMTRHLAARLRVFKVVLLEREGGLRDASGQRLAFLEMRRLERFARSAEAKNRRGVLRAITQILQQDISSVNLVAPGDVYEELFSYLGKGTLFTKAPYGSARPLSVDQFEQAQALIERGQNEGSLLYRTPEEIARLLPSCVGYHLGSEGQLAGICSLLTEPYRREKAGEITALYTLTRFQGEGIASQLVNELLEQARTRRLRYVFACTTEAPAARLFERLGFRRVSPQDVPKAKWRGYDEGRRHRITIFRYDLA